MILESDVGTPPPGFWRLLATRRSTFAIGTVVYLILAVTIFWPRAPWSTDSLPSGAYGHGFSDPQQMVWFLAWIPYALIHGLNIFHSNFLDFPRGVDLANTTSVPLLGLLATPITLSLGPVAAFNILLRLAFASSATSMFFVLRSWCRVPAAFIGGLTYGFGPYMVVQGTNHLDLVFVPLPPLIVWSTYRLLFKKVRFPSREGILLGALCGAQALIDPELLAMIAILLAVGCLGLTIVRMKDKRASLAPWVKAIPTTVLVFLSICGFFLWSLLFARGHLHGPVYPTGLLESIRSDLLEPIVPNIYQFIAPLALSTTAFRFDAGNFTENAGYLSVTFVALFFYFFYRERKNPIVVFSGCLALVAFVLSLGASLEFDGRTTSIRLPGALFSHAFLLRNFVPARFTLFVALFSIIAVSIGLDKFFAATSTHRSSRLLTRLTDMGVVALVITTAALMIPLVPFSTQTFPWSSKVASSLAVIPSGSVVLSYPFPIAPWTESMVWQAEDEMRFRLIGGYVTNQASSTSGSSNPVLVPPKVVEETLLQAQLGPHVHQAFAPFYKQPDPTTNLRSAFCAFIDRNHVGAIIFWKGHQYRGVDPGKVHKLFVTTLGEPTDVGANATILVWNIDKSGCSA